MVHNLAWKIICASLATFRSNNMKSIINILQLKHFLYQLTTKDYLSLYKVWLCVPQESPNSCDVMAGMLQSLMFTSHSIVEAMTNTAYKSCPSTNGPSKGLSKHHPDIGQDPLDSRQPRVLKQMRTIAGTRHVLLVGPRLVKVFHIPGVLQD